jgi:thioredoxin reductase (NADPH)
MAFVWNSVVEEILGEKAVTGVRIRNVETGEMSTLGVTGVFIFIGLTPNTAYLKDLLKMDGGGHIYVNEWMETDVPGIFAAGDIRANSARQVVSAAGDGATAAIRADQYITGRFGTTPVAAGGSAAS